MSKFWIVILCFGSLAWSAQNQMPNSSATKLPNETAPKEDIDQQITNAQLRAKSGSKSKVSIKTSFTYTGGSLVKPASEDRPEIFVSDAVEVKTKLSGNIGVKMKVSEQNSLSFGTGVGILTPFHGSASTVNDRSQYENPYLGYTHLERSGDWQMMSDISWTHYTARYAKMAKLNDSFTVSQTVLRELGRSGWNGSLSLGLSVSTYEDGKREGRSDYFLLLYPSLEYAFNDRYSFRTVFSYFNYMHMMTEPALLKLENNTRYQSMGLGVALTRDIYFYPNVQFIPEDLRDTRTNVGLSAYVNFF